MTSRFIEVDEAVLEDLIIEAARAPSEPRELDFKPNENLGEGTADPRELEYRKDLLKALERVYKAWDKVMAGSGSVDAKIKRLDPIIDRYIEELKDLALNYVTRQFNESYDLMKTRLKALGLKNVPPASKNQDRLRVILAYQMEAAEWSGTRLKYKIRNELRSDAAYQDYGDHK